MEAPGKLAALGKYSNFAGFASTSSYGGRPRKVDQLIASLAAIDRHNEAMAAVQ